MFTGIIEELGQVRSISARGENAYIVIEARLVTEDTKHGDSISVNGVCLTALDIQPDSFAADVSRETLDRSTQNHEAAVLVAHYLDLGHPIEPLIETFTYAIVREDADFHGIQMVEAAVREYLEWNGGPQGRTLMVAVARYLEAFAPTQRAQLHTARIGWRLHRVDNLYEDEITDV